MGNPKTISRPAINRAGTGSGGSGTGGVAAGGYDRYVGTLGLAADDPKSNIKHNTILPIAEPGHWVRVISPMKIGNVNLFPGQEYLCWKKTEANNLANWEIKAAEYGHVVRNKVTRINNKTVSIKPNMLTPIFFGDPLLEGFGKCYVDTYRTEISNFLPSVFVDDLVCKISVDLKVIISEWPAGDRQITMVIKEYSPLYDFGARSSQGSLLKGDPADNDLREFYGSYVYTAVNRAASQSSQELNISTQDIDVALFGEMQTIFTVWFFQNSDRNIDINFVRASITIDIKSKSAINRRIGGA